MRIVIALIRGNLFGLDARFGTHLPVGNYARLSVEHGIFAVTGSVLFVGKYFA